MARRGGASDAKSIKKLFVASYVEEYSKGLKVDDEDASYGCYEDDFAEMDVNGDGVVDREEYMAHMMKQGRL